MQNTLQVKIVEVNNMNTLDPVFLRIGKKIKERRLQLGLTATKLANLSGFSKQQISNWENGQRAVTLESVLKIQPILKVEASYLLGMEGVLNNDDPNNIYPIISMNNRSHDSLNNILSEKEFCIKDILPNDFSDSFIVYTVSDNSMNDICCKGDMIIFDKVKKPSDGDLVLIQILKTNQLLFRRYLIDHTDITNPQIIFQSNAVATQDIKPSSTNGYKILGVCCEQKKIIC